MSKNSTEEPNNYGMTDEVKEELVKLAKKIESGEIGNDPISKMMTGEVAEALVNLAKEVELGSMGNEELAKYLAIILRRLSRGKVKSLKKRKKQDRSAFDIILDRILKTFAKNNVKAKQNKGKTEPGSLVNSMINDLDSAINELCSASRLDSDLNDINLIEDVIAVNQKIAALSGRAAASVKGMSAMLIKAMSATASVSGMKGLATLSTLKGGVALGSWSQASKVNYDGVAGQVDAVSEQASESLHDKMKNSLTIQSLESIKAGPGDVPTTAEAKALKEKKNLEWEKSNSMN